MQWRFPTVNQRTLILGSSGSGKTGMGLWLLSYAPFHLQPYIIFDYKREPAIKQIDRARQIGLNELPRYPGLYVVRPMPVSDDERVLQFLRAIWHRQNIGLFFDEVLMLPQHGGALQALYTQGRTLRIPTISLSQRPVELNRFAFSETSYISVFKLNDNRDYKTVKQYIPRFDENEIEKLPKHNSLWYSQEDREFAIMGPVSYEGLPERINARLPARVHFI